MDAGFGTDDTLFFLRNERDIKGTGRNYTIIYKALDASLNISFDTAIVFVPVRKIFSRLYPNPFWDYQNFSFKSLEKSNLSIDIYDMTGRKLFNRSFSNTYEENIEIDFRSFSIGCYIVVVGTDNDYEMFCVVKHK